MTELESKSIYHQIQLERVENGVVKNCLLVLEKANKQIKAELKKTDGVYTKAKYKELRQYYKDVTKELKNNLNSEMNVEEFIEYELNAQIKLYKKYGNVQLVAPNKEQIITTATFTPYTSTSSFANYLDSFEYNYFNVWDSQTRLGYLNGLTTQQIVKNVLGYEAKNAEVAHYGEMQALKNSVMANTRTALQSYAMETHRMIYEKNENLFDGYKWVATLDRRTCIICGSKEGRIYKSYKEMGEVPPLHMNCRCTVLPYIKDMEDMAEGSTRASMNGQVDSSLTFEEWLGKQSVEVQKDVLGETRYKMFRDGVSMKSFISDNRVLTLEELKKMDL